MCDKVGQCVTRYDKVDMMGKCLFIVTKGLTRWKKGQQYC